MAAVLPSSDADRHPVRKRCFVNCAASFAERAANLPGFPVLPVASFAAAMLLTVVGGFGTGTMPMGMRATFWLLLIGWNAAKWQLWFAARVRAPTDWPRAAALGAIVINLPLPFEIAAALRLFGFAAPSAAPQVWAEALAISGAVFLVIAVIARQGREHPQPTGPAPPPAPDGLLARAGVRDPALLVAMEAEDHYCRLHLADGREPLIHARFGDALAETAALDGLRIHRGAWAAAAHVVGAVREERRWWLLLHGGARLPVSRPYLAAVRARGWLRRTVWR